MSALAYGLYRTAFHGGGLISRHRSRTAAERAQRRYCADTDCTCGCAVIVDLRDGEPREYVADGCSPYEARS